jgi:hypothetical protein
MNIKTITKTAAPALLILGWLLLPETAHCFYSPSTGRWLVRSQLPEFTALQLYAVAANNPVTFYDPNGDKADSQATSDVKAALPPINVPITPPTTVNSPSGNGAGNGPVARPVPVPVKYDRCDQPGSRRGGSTDHEQCPCSGIYVNCIKWERCERIVTTVGTSPLPPTYYWVPHRTCMRCPEGRYGSY